MLLKISVGGLANIAGGDASCLQKVHVEASHVHVHVRTHLRTC